MATKPTDRILDWASGGTATDPGGAKEASGWIVDERPPAFWWNWILNSFGQWLTWTEAEIDEFPATVRTRVLGRMHSPGGSVSTPVITSNTTDVGIDTPQSGDVTTTAITIRFTTAFADTKYTPVITSASAAVSEEIVTLVTRAASSMSVQFNRLSDGALVNPLTTSVAFFVDVKGAI